MEKTLDLSHEIGENITITDKSQLSSITPEQAKKIKSLRIENQTIDGGISLYLLFPDDNLEQIIFDNCSFSGSGLWILSEVPSASRIGFIRCGLTCDSLKDLLSSTPPYEGIEFLDLSDNNFENPKLFAEVLEKEIFRLSKSIETLVISDNGFDPTIIPLLKDLGGSSIGEIIL